MLPQDLVFGFLFVAFGCYAMFALLRFCESPFVVIVHSGNDKIAGLCWEDTSPQCDEEPPLGYGWIRDGLRRRPLRYRYVWATAAMSMFFSVFWPAYLLLVFLHYVRHSLRHW
jgi:hypothetical protein